MEGSRVLINAAAGSGAPTSAKYIVAELNVDLSAEVAPGSDDQVPVSDSSTAATWRTLTNCAGAGKAVTYDTATNAWGCNTISGTNAVTNSLVLSGGSGYFSTTLSGQTWVASTSKITCTILGTTADSLTVEAITVAGLTLTISDLVVGTGFNVNVFSPYGLTGTVRFHCIGA